MEIQNVQLEEKKNTRKFSVGSKACSERHKIKVSCTRIKVGVH